MKILWFIGSFFLGAVIALVPCVIVIALRPTSCDTPTTVVTTETTSVRTTSTTTSTRATTQTTTTSIQTATTTTAIRTTVTTMSTTITGTSVTTVPNRTTTTTTSILSTITASLTTSISTTISTTPASEWNETDYMSNHDYYGSLPLHDFSQTDNLRIDRLSSPKFHPGHGKTIVYLRRQARMPNVDKSTTTFHWLDLETNLTVRLTKPIWGVHDQQFFWIDNNTILFLSNRGTSRLTQIFQLNLPATISATTSFLEPIQITDYPLSIDNLVVNRQATRLAFSCIVYANLSIEETVAYDKAIEESGRTIYRFNKLFIRHWDEYKTGLRYHPFVVSIARQPNGIFNFTSQPRDLLFNIDSDSPTRPFGEARTQWSFSASGDSFAYTRQYDETSAVAWSTNLDIFTVDLRTPNQPSVCITCANPATDTDPTYSPIDENILLYRAHAVPSYESDQYKVKMYNAAGSTTTTILDNWDQSIQAITWALDGQSVYLDIGENGNFVIYHVADILGSPTPTLLLSGGTSHIVDLNPVDNQQFLYTYSSFIEPSNIYLYSSSTSQRSLTEHNSMLMSKVRISKVVSAFSFNGANNETVWGWHVAPANGTMNKAPLAFLIHGGPQSSWYNSWGSGWNFQAYAGQGYGVVAINFHGSDSYGQNFTDSIQGEYGTLPYQDLKIGLNYALSQFSYIDENRMVALGASFGGYMINWIAGQSELNYRFRTFVNHNGLFDMRAMAYSTEELWFTEYDAGGVTQYDNPEAYEKHNPVNYVANWTQPMLIIVGAHDYRVPETQGIGAFTALQRRNITSRLLYFPTENHWILNSQHSIAWFDYVYDWMRTHTS